MNATTQKITRFGLLTALALVLGLMDRAIPLTALLGGAAPGIKLGLANTVLLYAVYLMDGWSALLLMFVKVVLSGLIYGSLTAILYSLAGGILSLAVMLAVRRRAREASLAAFVLAAACDAYLLYRNPHPKGQMLLAVILIAAGAAACLAAWILNRMGKIRDIPGTSVAGASVVGAAVVVASVVGAAVVAAVEDGTAVVAALVSVTEEDETSLVEGSFPFLFLHPANRVSAIAAIRSAAKNMNAQRRFFTIQFPFIT